VQDKGFSKKGDFSVKETESKKGPATGKGGENGCLGGKRHVRGKRGGKDRGVSEGGGRSVKKTKKKTSHMFLNLEKD